MKPCELTYRSITNTYAETAYIMNEREQTHNSLYVKRKAGADQCYNTLNPFHSSVYEFLVFMNSDLRR